MAPTKAKAKADPKVKADKTKQEANAKAADKAAAKAAADPASSQLALEAKKEQQNFVNTLKYRASKCNSTEAQQLLKAHWDIFFLFLKMIYADYGAIFVYLLI